MARNKSFGWFSHDGKEFHITDVATPSPWINYLYSGEYFTFISNNGGGMSYVGNPLHGRISRYRINDVPSDRPGKYIYVRDEETGDSWSLTWQPVGREKSAYRIVHGFGYTRSEADLFGIASSVLFVVPKDQNLEVWRAVLHNTSNRRRRLSVFVYVEFCLGHALIDLINQCDDQHFNRVYFDAAQNTLFATKTYWVTESRGTQHQENKAWDRWAFLTCSRPVQAYETVRERFIGPTRTETNPLGVEMNRLSSKDMDCGNAVGVLLTSLDVAPGETGDVVFNLGVVPKKNMSAPRLNTVCLFEPDVTRALGHVRKGWDEFFSAIQVNTPDDRMNIFLNGWTPYQARVAFDVGRVASFYYWGIGRGLGFRDTAQDILAVVASEPEKAKDRIRLLARQMFSDGRVYHHFLGNGQGETTGHCDDPLWFILAVTEYVKETGDTAVLDDIEPYLEERGKTRSLSQSSLSPKSQKPDRSLLKEGTILDHCRAVVRFAKNNLSPRGLPVFGRGDWNDTLDYIGGEEGGESVWGGFFYAAMLGRLEELLRFIGKEDFLKEVEDLKQRLAAALESYAWDGKWFLRAFGAGDTKIGSSGSTAGRIFLNSQTWAVISGIVGRNRQVQAMNSVWKHLDSPFGPKICAPAFREIDPDIGLITRCVHGKKENAAVFLHPTAWAIMAECFLGRGDRAYAVYKKLLPDAVPSETFRAEPYVYSQYITSDEHSEAGRASHSWQTGTAAWMYKVMIDYFLGVRPEYGGLRVDPVIPPGWKAFSIERVFRGTRYRISVLNPQGVMRGVRSVVCDGKEQHRSLLPLSGNPVCDVRVTMGVASSE